MGQGEAHDARMPVIIGGLYVLEAREVKPVLGTPLDGFEGIMHLLDEPPLRMGAAKNELVPLILASVLTVLVFARDIVVYIFLSAAHGMCFRTQCDRDGDYLRLVRGIDG